MLDLEEMLAAGDWDVPDTDDPATLDPATLDLETLDPFTLLENMHLSTAAGVSCLDTFGRYVAGEPLVRKHRELKTGWSFLCPDPRCQVWRTDFPTPAACRTGWYTHCDERRHDFTASWPADVPFEQPTQPLLYPDDRITRENLLADMSRQGLLVDRAGRKLTNDRCEPCFTVGEHQHRVVSGTTCPGQMPCSKCGAEPGKPCDRTNTPGRELSPITFGRNGMFSGHYERFTAAVADEERRWNEGDLRCPAPWRQTMAATTRRSKPPKSGMKATLRVDTSSDDNPMWRSLVYELMDTGRFRWARVLQRAVIAFPDSRSARLMAGTLTKFYGVPAEAVTVEDSLIDWHEKRLFTDLVKADAEQVMRTFTKDTPKAHLVWATGVLTASHRPFLMWNHLTAKGLAQECGDGNGGACRNYQYTNTRRGFVVHRHVGAQLERVEKVAPWADVLAMIQGTVPDAEMAELRAATIENRTFPLYTAERDRCGQWMLDLALQAWMRVRPADMPPFDSRVALERVAQPR